MQNKAMNPIMNNKQRRAYASQLRKSAGVKMNPFAPDGIEFIKRGAKTCSNRSRPLGRRTRKGAN